MEPTTSGRGESTTNNLNKAIQQFRAIKATLDRLVVNQDDKITELYDRKPVDFHLVKDIPLNLKVKLDTMLSPLTIFISYPHSSSSKKISFYLSHTNKEPSSSNCTIKYLNPTTVKVEGAIKDLKQGGMIFEDEWLYLTIVSE
jgi:hypothetical protein